MSNVELQDVNPETTSTAADSPEQEELTPELSLLFKKIEKLMDPLKNDLANLTIVVNRQETQINKIDSLTTENIRLQRSCEMLAEENVKLKQRLNNVENSLLSKNVILHGVREDSWETEAQCTEKIIRILAGTIDRQSAEEQMNIARCIPIIHTKRIGRPSSRRARLISICFERQMDVKHLFENREYLPEGVFVTREYCEATENNRRILRPVLNLAKRKAAYKGKCKLEGDNLIIKGKSYSVYDVHKLPSDINGFKATSKTSNQALCFFGELNPLSNFHNCNFVVNGKSYHSTEQYIQHTKAMYFDDKETADSIMQCKTALESKRLSSHI
ncbi:MAG: NADAR family protein, partial [Proteobacteria bacterium]|nr:NADAR family protein [Pseudomonadota bacterium]